MYDSSRLPGFGFTLMDLFFRIFFCFCCPLLRTQVRVYSFLTLISAVLIQMQNVRLVISLLHVETCHLWHDLHLYLEMARSKS
ncbi:MAG: hypothetical protein ACI8QD_000380, partial [Cyclobacteriaceae bacterium]